MRIGIDARFYGPEAKGLGRYTEQLVRNLLELDKENTYVLFLRHAGMTTAPDAPNVEKVLAEYPWYSVAEQVYLPRLVRRFRVDLYHVPHFNAPLFLPAPLMVTIHDLILTKFPTVRASTLGAVRYAIKHLAYQFIIRRALSAARLIFTISEFSKRDLLAHFPFLPPSKIVVTYEAAEPLQSDRTPADDSTVLGSYGVREPFFLYVGNAYPHKNLDQLLEAFAKLRNQRPELSLVLVGREDYFFRRLRDEAERRGIADHVRYPGFVTDRDLPSLYRRASAYVFPSLYEGFGLPPLEAMHYGTPVISSRSSSLPEVLGDAVEYFNPNDVGDMMNAMSRILDDRELRTKLQQRGKQCVATYSWRRMAEATLNGYRKTFTA